MNIDAKILSIVHHDQVGFISGMQGFFHICKSVNVIYHVNKVKDKNHMIILVQRMLSTKYSTHLWFKTKTL